MEKTLSIHAAYPVSHIQVADVIKGFPIDLLDLSGLGKMLLLVTLLQLHSDPAGFYKARGKVTHVQLAGPAMRYCVFRLNFSICAGGGGFEHNSVSI